LILNEKFTKPIGFNTWNTYLQKELPKCEAVCYFIFNYLSENKLKIFRWKLLHFIIPTKKLLLKWKIMKKAIPKEWVDIIKTENSIKSVVKICKNYVLIN
jgi:hypothetical protein